MFLRILKHLKKSDIVGPFRLTTLKLLFHQ